MYKIKKLITNPKSIIFSLSRDGLLKFLPDKVLLKIIFFLKFNKKLDLRNPKSFNEKLQWLKLYDRNSLYTQLVDKYGVRKYIAKEIGEEYLIPLLGVWETFDEIDFSKLPNEFVLKCTHDSGGVVICKDKKNFNIEDARKKIEKSLKNNFYYAWREWPYKNVKPRIICEKLMLEDSGKDLKDYKLMCFNGKVKCTLVCSDRNDGNLKIDFYDNEWNLMPFRRSYPNSDKPVKMPQNFTKMIELAELLSKDFQFIRVDFYEVNGRIYFGELTFYPASGFSPFIPEGYDSILGSWINLDNK